jgi:hypothetical protein
MNSALLGLSGGARLGPQRLPRLVEINLTSNHVILGIVGKEHPFPTYRKFGVPVALCTDDEGVSRIDLTREYVRAVETYALTYADLKELVRNSLDYSFLGGGSLWDDGGAYARVVAACRSDVSGADKPSLRLFSRRERQGEATMGT